MKNYLDESGAFDWRPEGVSVFAGVTITDRSLPNVVRDFREWKNKIAQIPPHEEVKGARLNEVHLDIFVKWVVLPHPDFYVSLVGVDTRNTREATARLWIDDAARVCRAASDFENSRGNPTSARHYHTMANWLEQRSPQNGLWMALLPRAILRTMQQTIVRHFEPKDDAEFEEWAILIDRSFIHTTRHEDFWRAWLRAVLFQATNQEPLDTPEDWLKRDHPHTRKYKVRNVQQVYVDASELFRDHTRFADSQIEEGLQLADVCGAIARRFFADGWHSPYERLGPRIFRDADGTFVRFLHLDETSLRHGRPASEGVKFFDLEADLAPADDVPGGGADVVRNGPVT